MSSKLDFLTSVAEYEIQIKLLEEGIEQYRPEFISYCSDRSIDVYDRYEVWCNAPKKLKNGHHGWILHVPHMEKYLDKSYAERYQHIDLEDVLEYLDEDPYFTDTVIREFLEGIMRKNYSSFSYDW